MRFEVARGKDNGNDMKLEATPTWLSAQLTAPVGKVDREKGIIHGVILAEEGPFKSAGRGEFNRAAIQQIVTMANQKPGGLKARWTHPGLSSDGLGKFLGRQKNIRTDTVLRSSGRDTGGDGLAKPTLVARGDLHLDATALDTPPEGGKPLGVYVMDLAESDPDAFGTSLVLRAKQEYRLKPDGRPMQNDNGEDLPPLWFPEALHSSDVVDDGDATNSFLSADILAGLPDAVVRQGCELLDAQFLGQDAVAVRARLTAFVDRYLRLRFGEPDEEEDNDEDEDLLLQIAIANGKS